MRSMVEGTSMLHGPQSTVKKARRLRRVMTIPEVILWTRLRQRPGGFKFRRQHPAGPYVLDFFCSEARLAIEVDGIVHDMGDNPGGDQTRDAWLEKQGVTILRLGAGDVSRAPDSIVEQIVARCLEGRIPLHQPAAGPPPRAGEET